MSDKEIDTQYLSVKRVEDGKVGVIAVHVSDEIEAIALAAQNGFEVVGLADKPKSQDTPSQNFVSRTKSAISQSIQTKGASLQSAASNVKKRIAEARMGPACPKCRQPMQKGKVEIGKIDQFFGEITATGALIVWLVHPLGWLAAPLAIRQAFRRTRKRVWQCHQCVLNVPR